MIKTKIKFGFQKGKWPYFLIEILAFLRHINIIYDEGELDKKSTCAKNAHEPLTRNRLFMVYMAIHLKQISTLFIQTNLM